MTLLPKGESHLMRLRISFRTLRMHSFDGWLPFNDGIHSYRALPPLLLPPSAGADAGAAFSSGLAGVTPTPPPLSPFVALFTFPSSPLPAVSALVDLPDVSLPEPLERDVESL